MQIDLPIEAPYRLVSVQQVRRKSTKGFVHITWAVALCVDRPTEETGLHYGFGEAPTIAEATEKALAQSRWREEQETKFRGQIFDTNHLKLDFTI